MSTEHDTVQVPPCDLDLGRGVVLKRVKDSVRDFGRWADPSLLLEFWFADRGWGRGRGFGGGDLWWRMRGSDRVGGICIANQKCILIFVNTQKKS